MRRSLSRASSQAAIAMVSVRTRAGIGDEHGRFDARVEPP